MQHLGLYILFFQSRRACGDTPRNSSVEISSRAYVRLSYEKTK